MFSQFFFLLLTIILINFETDKKSLLISDPVYAFFLSLILFAFLLIFFVFQIKIFKRTKVFSSSTSLINLINFELILFLCLYQFGLGGYRLFAFEGPNNNPVQIFSNLFSLSLYLFGLGFAYYHLQRSHFIKADSPFDYAYRQVQFLFPFCIPFIFFNILLDGLNYLPGWYKLINSNDPIAILLLIIVTVLFVSFTAIFLPWLIIKFWRCKPLTHTELLQRLESVSKYLHFKHAGIKIWTVMKHSFTAGIIGVAPSMRYIMFTERLIDSFSPDEIEAILIHEIGHSKYKHLLFYPLIFLGSFLTLSLSIPYISTPMTDFFDYQNNLKPSPVWNLFYYIALFVIYSCILALFLRVVFGFFSRLFERQADLYIYKFTDTPRYMIQALNHIGVSLGHIHMEPNWHHGSIQERIDFLNETIRNPSLIQKHHYKTKVAVVLFLIYLFICIIGLALQNKLV